MNKKFLKKTFLLTGIFLLSMTMLGNLAFAKNESSEQLIITAVYVDFEYVVDDPENPVLDLDSIVTVPEEEEIIENVPITMVDQVPVFPGCKGDNNELLKCFNKKMQKHFAKKFDSDLPNELGLSPGKKRLIMLFKIDRTGNIVDIRAKAPHPRLQKEAIRIIKLLPKMTPGKQRGKPVGVKYTLPMRIDVE